MKSIHQFIKEVKAKSCNSNSNVILWTDEFRKAGYYHAEPDSLLNWSEMHQWCNHHIGCENYAWNGTNFWFENDKACMLFKLRWS